MNIMPLFCSFFAEDVLNLDNDRLARFCRDVRERDAGRTISNQGGWQSNLIGSVTDETRELYNEVMIRADAVNRSIGFGGPAIRMQSFWININQKENYNEPHDHPMSFYAAVYYVKARGGQGKIKFVHPMPFFSNYAMANDIKEYGMFNSTTWEIEPRTGLFLLFPSYLTHFVSRNTTDEDRISIAFNFGIDRSSP